MSTTRDPEGTLLAWLDEGPTELPDATRRAILTSLPTIPQARRGMFAPWRSSLMNTTTRFAAAAIVAVIAIGGLAYVLGPRLGPGGPTPTPSFTPTSTPQATSAGSTVDRSLAAGYTIVVPADWRWQIEGKALNFSTSGLITSAQLFEGDVATGAGAEYVIDEGGANFGGSTIRGHDLAELSASINEFFTAYWSSTATNQRSVTIDGEAGSIVEHPTTGPDRLFIDAVVVHRARAYLLIVSAPSGNAADLRAALDEMLASIRWTS